ncbi:hypothetical protein EXIGLDRAFT_722018 [Exidia glandulosa HHB12029]|uniref:Uncharacterized protein n=1 Tax=Exidia glandulosa HHB12029 TaxID=1314781 RepID=A0A165FJ34_EXIGL|nr:hypothetical protein EXIGLDRAFT_722018 [Exidia glandulosa HHB12029]
MTQRTELLTYIQYFDMPVLHYGYRTFEQLRLRDVLPLMHSLHTLVLPEMDVLAYELWRDTGLDFLPATLEQLAFTRSCAVPLTWLGDAMLLRDRPKSAADQEGDDCAKQVSSYDTWFAESYDMHSLLCRHELMKSLLASTNVTRVAFSCCDPRPGGPLHLKHLLLHGISFQRLEMSYKAYMLLTSSAMGLNFNHLHTLVVKRILRGNRLAGDIYNETKQLIQPEVAAQFPALKVIRMSQQTHRYPNLLSTFPWIDLLWAALPSLELVSIESFALDWYLEWHRSGQTMQLTLGPDIERHMERQEASERPWYGKPQSMWFEQHLVEPWRW